MGRGPRARGSRSERRQRNERAASAAERGLPLASAAPARVAAGERASTRDRGQGVDAAGSKPRLPVAIKLLGVGLALLIVIYGLTLLRDRPRAPEPGRSQATLESDALSPVPAPQSSAQK